VPLDRAIPWEEYELTFYELPGHTLYAVAIGVEVDGKRVLVTGDHQQDRWLNYTYQNRFRIGDFRDSADLYQRLRPELIVSGHWDPIWVDDEYLSDLATRGRMLERLHQELLPLEDVNFEAEGFGAWIGPYQSRIADGGRGLFNVAIRNPFDRHEDACVEVVVPAGWRAEPATIMLRLAPRETANAEFAVVPPRGIRIRRARIAVDLTVADRRFGQQAEALVDVVARAPSDGDPGGTGDSGEQLEIAGESRDGKPDARAPQLEVGTGG
jgi:hypothetical protein